MNRGAVIISHVVLAFAFVGLFPKPVFGEHDILTITYYHYPPKIRVTDSGPVGLYVNQLEQIVKRAGYRIKWLPTDTVKEAAMLDAGKRAFCTTGRMPTKARALKWRFFPYLFAIEPGDVVLTRAEIREQLLRYKSIVEVATDPALKGVLLRSAIYGEAIDKHLESEPVWIDRTGGTDLHLMKMILAGRADWTMVPQEQWKEGKRLEPALKALVEISDFGAHPDYPIHIVCSKAIDDETFTALSRAMHEAGFQPRAIPQ